MEMRVASVIDEESRETKYQGNAIRMLEERLKLLRHAADSNNKELWEYAENSFLNIIGNLGYSLAPAIRIKYLNAYYNIIPREELSMKLMGLKDSEIVDRDSLPTQSLKRGKKARTTSKSNSRDISQSGILRKCYLDVRDFESGEDYLDIENLELRGEGDD